VSSHEHNEIYEGSKDFQSAEEKLVSEITKPTGVSYNPTENQLKELVRRAKTLNQEVLYDSLLNKVYDYNNITNNNSMKEFTVRKKNI